MEASTLLPPPPLRRRRRRRRRGCEQTLREETGNRNFGTRSFPPQG
jgi:hypothetical protein